MCYSITRNAEPAQTKGSGFSSQIGFLVRTSGQVSPATFVLPGQEAPKTGFAPEDTSVASPR